MARAMFGVWRSGLVTAIPLCVSGKELSDRMLRLTWAAHEDRLVELCALYFEVQFLESPPLCSVRYSSQVTTLSLEVRRDRERVKVTSAGH